MKSILKLVLIMINVIVVGCTEDFLFKEVKIKHSGIDFINQIIENDTLNPLEMVNIYNGGGVGIGDFNNDGLDDIYFTGNISNNKLYINKGNFVFMDVTKVSNVEGNNRWSKGVSVIDINNDGLLDLYVSCSIYTNKKERENLLYINQGNTEDNIPVFKEMAAAYGLNDSSHTTMSYFFDFDHDGDLDVFLAVNEIKKDENPNLFRHAFSNSEHSSTDRLYENTWDTINRRPLFIDISKKAGITIEGYSHASGINDFNNDGWLDIYVTNDFMPNNLLYISNQDGTFTNKIKDYFKHTSSNSMGLDISDINNDGLQDLIELDMNPKDNYRKKTMMNGANYTLYQKFDDYNYQHQYVRNTLQLNMGVIPLNENTKQSNMFSEIGLYAGISETDWSWAPLLADFDNDGLKDLFITNGYPKDVTDHDFISFRNKSYQVTSIRYLLSQIPKVKIPNYIFKNKNGLQFIDVTKEWGLQKSTFSNGAVYSDLDNDGDLDLVINNINDKALVYENTLEGKKGSENYLKIKLIGAQNNINAIGTTVTISSKESKQVLQQFPYRGYLSSVPQTLFFGLGNQQKIDSIKVKWPSGELQYINNISINGLTTIKYDKNSCTHSSLKKSTKSFQLLKKVNEKLKLNHLAEENDFVDFNTQKLLPHKFSEQGPSLVAGDINNDGFDDFIVAGSTNKSPFIFIQHADGTFEKTPLLLNIQSKDWEETGLSLFDADNDGDLDLYTASGGNEKERKSTSYQDLLYLNNGYGDFKVSAQSLPLNTLSTSCVRVSDYDRDGDLDIFVAGRVDPGNYPNPVSSFIYRNDSDSLNVKFTDVTKTVNPGLLDLGMVTDAIWTDFNNDGYRDLVVVGEWMNPLFFTNKHGVFEEIKSLGSQNIKGIWNSIVPGDFDNDGDIDYVLGNLGKNTYSQPSKKYPMTIYGIDFNENNLLTCIPTTYLKDSSGNLNEYTTHTRDDVIEQMPFIKKNFLSYNSFAMATVNDIFSKEQLNNALKLQANYLSSILLVNNGNGDFKIVELPPQVQWSQINGMLAEDIDDDGHLDILLVGNNYGQDVYMGRSDAFNGLVLKGNGQGQFKALSIAESGFFVPNDARSLIKLRGAMGEMLVVASQNKGELLVFEKTIKDSIITLQKDDQSVMLFFKNGKTQKIELNHGASYLSQSSRFINISNKIKSIIITNANQDENIHLY